MINTLIKKRHANDMPTLQKSIKLISTTYAVLIVEGCNTIAKAPEDKKEQMTANLVWQLEAEGIPPEHTMLYLNSLAESMKKEQ